jgi:hypothetical protein
MDFLAGWACPGSFKQCFQMWFHAVISRSIINTSFEFFYNSGVCMYAVLMNLIYISNTWTMY